MLKARNFYFLVIILLFVSLVLNIIIGVNFWIFVILIIAILSLLIYGSSNIQADFFTKSYHTPTHSRNEIAITFDDGPTEHTEEILDLLKEFDAKATFFCIGNRIDKNQDIVQRMHDEGHSIGNHTYSHKNFFPFFKKKRMREELSKTSQHISEITGNEVSLFRPPFGIMNTTIVKATKAENLKIIGWNLRLHDSPKTTTEKVLQRIPSNIKTGTVVLLHNTHRDSGTIVRAVLDEIKTQNLSAVTVNQIFDMNEAD